MSYVTITIWIICSIFLIVAWATAESNCRRGKASIKTAKQRIKALEMELNIQNENLDIAYAQIDEIKKSNEDLLKFKDAYYLSKKENAQTAANHKTYAELIAKLQKRLLRTEYAGNSLASALSAEIEKSIPSEDPNIKDERVQNTFQKMRKSMK